MTFLILSTLVATAPLTTSYPRLSAGDAQEKEVATLVFARRPDEEAMLPRYVGKPFDLAALAVKARAARYSERRVGDTLYLFSPRVLPIDAWAEEARARRRILEGVAPDGTLKMRTDSEEAGYLFDRIGATDDYGPEITAHAYPHASLRLESGGRTISLMLNDALRPLAKVPRAEARRGPEARPRTLRTMAWGQAHGGAYAFEEAGKEMFATEECLRRRGAALDLVREIAAPHLRAEREDGKLLYARLAPMVLDERRFPARGTTFASLPPSVRDDVEHAIRTDPDKYGFADVQEGLKWLGGASVAHVEGSVGLGIETERGGSIAILASRRY